MRSTTVKRDPRVEPAGVGETHRSLLAQDRYVLREAIGRSEVAAVYRATDLTLNRSVAVALLHAHVCADTQVAERFFELEQRLAQLPHPHLVTIFDAGMVDNRCFVVMEDVTGGSLRAVLAREKILPVSAAVKVASQVADALEYLHGQGIVHGDIKPETILLDDQGKAKLVDVGLAHVTRTTDVTGTVDGLGEAAAYLSPEQVERGHVDERSDIYALGLVTYEALAGRRAFEGEHWVAVATQRLVRDPDPLRRARPDVPVELDQVVMHALARDPDRRFASAGELRYALQEVSLPRFAPTDVAQGRAREGVPPVPEVQGTAANTAAMGPSGSRAAWTTASTAARAGEATAPLPVVSVGPAARVVEGGGGAGPSNATYAIPFPVTITPTHVTTTPAPSGAVGARPRRSLWKRRSWPSWPPSLIRRLFHDRNPTMRRRVAAASVIGLLLFALALPRLIYPPQVVRIPELTGRTVDAAREAARQVGVRIRVAEENSESVAKGQVLRQEPAANATSRNDQPVRLVVSRGPPPVRMPDLRDRRLDDARKDLEAAGLALGKVEEREVTRRPWGTIVRQSVRVGSPLAQGGSVDVVVGGPPWTIIPKVVDKALGDAEGELHKRGLRVGEVRLAPVNGKRAGTVIAQDAADGVRLRQGESVALTVAVPAPAAPAKS